MRQATVRERLRYAFDNTLSHGPLALIAWLAVISAALILLISLVVHLFGWAPDDQKGLINILWLSLLRTLDSGTMGGDTGGWPFLLAMLAVTFGGIFVISTLIGVLTSGIEEKIAELRKGRSRVLVDNHTVILGWSPQVFAILSELVTAHESDAGATLVVLGGEDKVVMEDAIRDKVGPTGRTRIVCRTGSAIDLNDLEIVSVRDSKAVIILAPESDDPDAEVIKTLLAITNNPERRPEPYHIVAEIRDPKNLEVARMVAKDEAELVLVGDLIARVIAQTCRQSGLSVVYTELLDFGGDEIYFKEEPALVGKTFGESLHAFETSAVMGLRTRTGGAQLNPPMDTRIEAGDRMIVVAQDDSAIRLGGGTPRIEEAAIRKAGETVARTERTLVLGWSELGAVIVRELNAYVTPGSSARIVAVLNSEEEAHILAGLPKDARQTVTLSNGDPTDRRTLDSLGIPEYDHVILLSSDNLGAQQSDARTLVTLLHLRDIRQKQGGTFSIVSEMRDVRNRRLAEVTQADDFIVSEKLVSLMLAQISTNKDLNAVFADLFDPEGSEVYLKPAEQYLALGQEVDFYTVVEAARRQSAVAIGYRRQALSKDASRAYGVVVNPKKSDRVTFAAGDKIVVLAEN